MVTLVRSGGVRGGILVLRARCSFVATATCATRTVASMSRLETRARPLCRSHSAAHHDATTPTPPLALVAML